MKIDAKRTWKALGIGVLVTLPVLVIYATGEALENIVLNALAGATMTPAMIIGMPLLFLSGVVPNPDTYVLGTYFLLIPVLSVMLYTLLAYGGLTLATKLK